MLTKDAIKHFGSITALAEAVGVTTQAISQWPESVPPLRQIQLQQITFGKLRAVKNVFEHPRSAA